MKSYCSPELELVRFSAEDSLLASAQLPPLETNETPVVPFPSGRSDGT